MQLTASSLSLLSFVALALANPLSFSTPPKTPIIQRSTPGNKSVAVQLFQWNWNSVAEECKTFLGPAGYGFVQVSPATEHIQGSQWYTDYQVVSYKLESKHGSRQEFKSMVETCHAAGVKVIVDTVLNHMAGVDSGSGVAGSPFTHYDYPGLYTTADFHHCGLNANDAITHWDSKPEAQVCQLANLADLDTSSESVRTRLAAHIDDLVSCGVDGLRLDAAKHISVVDLTAILAKVSTQPAYITSEVVSWTNDADITTAEYAAVGDVQEFRYSEALEKAFTGGDLSSLKDLELKGWTVSEKANVFVVNHDGERSNYALRPTAPSNTYTLAQIFSLAYTYGSPTVYSSFAYSNPDEGAPNNGAGSCAPNSGYLCQHRWTPVQGLARFRNAVGADAVNNWTVDGKTRVSFGRGNAGFVAINNGDEPWTTTHQTWLPDGIYCDVVSGALVDSTCTGAEIEVKAGKITTTLAARTAFAIHADEGPESFDFCD